MEVIEPQASEMIKETQAMQSGEALPPGQEPVVEPAVEVPAEAAPEAEALTGESVVEVDGQKFANESEAFAYLKGQYGQLQTEKMLEEARVQGMQEALHSMPQQGSLAPAPVAPEPEMDMNKFYEDPAGYLKEMKQKISEDLTASISAKQSQTQRDTEVWNTFTTTFPDLADFRGDVEIIATEHRDTLALLSRRDPKKAMEFVALKTREKFQRYNEALKPTRTLSNAKVGPSHSGNHPVTTAAPATNPSEKIDFISQMRSMRKK